MNKIKKYYVVDKIDVCRIVLKDQSFKKIKEYKTKDGKFVYQVEKFEEIDWNMMELTEDHFEDIKTKSEWTIIDMYSASAIMQIYNYLSERQKAHVANWPIKRMQTLAFRLIEASKR